MFEAETWSAVPFHFWSVVCFTVGTMIGSFLNVCIHRMPRGESIVRPRSHCPHCGYMIPGPLNIPLVTWLYLRGKCANCQAPISIRYFLVELLTGVVFLVSWLSFGPLSPGLALAYCVLLAGFIAATFIDLEHFIIPDEITIGGIFVGLVLSLLVPALHDTSNLVESLLRSLLGAGAGAGLVFGVLKFGKLLFGREKIDLAAPTRLIFTETDLHLPDRVIPYEDIFFNQSDTIVLQAQRVELIDRCYRDVPFRLCPSRLTLGTETFVPEDVKHMEIVTDRIVLPREAMGFGDVKFMAAIGAFLGWQAVIFSLTVSAIIGSAVGLSLIGLGRKEWSSRLPYGPYIALAATLWIFGGNRLFQWFISPPAM